jgi:DNA-binding response OmpR family regulator
MTRVERSTVLVVEEDRALFRRLSSALDDGGFLVVRAGELDDALRMAEMIRPAVVVLSVSVVDPRSWLALGVLAVSPVTADTPVALLLRHPDAHRGLALAVDRWLLHPSGHDGFAAAAAAARGDRSGPLLALAPGPVVGRYLADISRQGVDVVMVSSVEDAAAVGASGASLIVVDLLEGQGNGLEAAVELQRNQGTKGVPVLACVPRILSRTERQTLRTRFGLVPLSKSLEETTVTALQTLTQRRTESPTASPLGDR